MLQAKQLPDGQIYLIKENNNFIIAPLTEMESDDILAYVLGSYITRCRISMNEHMGHVNCAVTAFHRPILDFILNQSAGFMHTLQRPVEPTMPPQPSGNTFLIP